MNIYLLTQMANRPDIWKQLHASRCEHHLLKFKLNIRTEKMRFKRRWTWSGCWDSLSSSGCGFTGIKLQLVPFLSAKDRMPRHTQGHQNGKIRDWKYIAWSDESIHWTPLVSTVTRSTQHLCNVVQQEASIVDVHPTDLHQMEEATVSVRTKIQVTFQQIASMPQCIKAVLKEKWVHVVLQK